MTLAELPADLPGEDPAQYYHLYKAAFDNSNQGICVFDLVFDDDGQCHDLIFLATNKAYDEHSPLRDVVGKNLRSLLPNFEQYWLDFYARVAATGRSESYENYTKEGDRWSRVHASRVGGAGSRTVLAVFENVTERKRAELELQDNARSQAFLLALADDLRTIADPVAIQETASRLVGEYLKVDRVGYAEIEGMGDDAMIVLSRDWCRAGTRSLVGRYPLEAFGTFVLETALAGRPVVINDVLSDERFTASDVANWKPMGIGAAIAHSLIKDGRFLAYLFAHASGPRRWTAEDIAVLAEVAERTWAAVERAKAEDALRKSHEMLEARVRERTQQASAARDEAERNAALKSQFLAATAHDLRQPLQAIMTYLPILRRKAGNPEAETLCDRAVVQLQAMKYILDTLLDLSRLEGGDITPQICDFDIDALIAAVITTYQPMAQAKGLKLEQVKGGLTGRSDPALLDRIVANLVSNAIRYTSEGGITVGARGDAGMVEISVSDTGIGIPADALVRIFDPFVQINNPARDRSKGLGLGLSIVRAIAQSLRHHVDVTSEEGKGTIFRIFIPESGRPDEAVADLDVPDRPPMEPEEQRTKILLVDDDPAVLDSMAMLLRMENFEVVCAADCGGAIAIVKGGYRPSILISDLNLPDGNGRDLIGAVRQHAGFKVPAILLTGEIRRNQTEAGGGDGYEVLYKPIGLEELMEAVTRANASGPR